MIDGAYAVTVSARDATGNETSTTAFITVDTSATLVQIERLANGHTRVRFPGTPGRTYRLLASDDLVHWDTIASVTVSISGILDFEDTDAASHPQRFYQTAKP